jgi:iron complex transport system ATP-binding protein
MSDPIVVRDIAYAYGERPVIKQVSFSVAAGQFFIVIGPNGSGKSTLLRMLAGMLHPVTGRVELNGRLLSRYSRRQIARKVAFVPQSTMLSFPFTVQQVVLMGRAPHLGWPAIEGKADWHAAREAMTYTGTDHLATRRISEISGGEQQRVFLARALCQTPQILLLDEPTAALDLRHQLQIMDLLEQLIRERGITVIMVSHDLNLAAIYARRLLLMAAGTIAHIGTPESVLLQEHLEAVYRCPLLVSKSPAGAYPQIHLLPQRHANQ